MDDVYSVDGYGEVLRQPSWGSTRVGYAYYGSLYAGLAVPGTVARPILSESKAQSNCRNCGGPTLSAAKCDYCASPNP